MIKTGVETFELQISHEGRIQSSKAMLLSFRFRESYFDRRKIGQGYC